MKAGKLHFAFRIALLGSAWIFSARASAQSIVIPTPTPLPSSFIARFWPESFFQTAMRTSEEAQYRFTNAMFNGATDAGIFSEGNQYASFSIEVGRGVFNNVDVLNTWTVIDRIRLRLASTPLSLIANLPVTQIGTEAISFPFASVNFGVNSSLELRDSWQVAPVKTLTSIDVSKIPGNAEDDIQVINPYLDASPLNSPLRVKLRDVLNPVILPFKIPFSRSDVLKMQDGELFSYNVTGQLGFGGSFGWKIIPSATVTAGATIRVETHITGEFQISILKEKGHFVKVRVSKVHGSGKSAEVSAGVDFNDIYKGFLLFKGSMFQTTVGETSARIVPFDFKLSTSRSQEIDTGYRYDLNSIEGADAFHRAVLGSFIQSDELSKSEIGNAAPAVTLALTRTTESQNSSRSASSNLSIFLQLNHDHHTNSLVTEIKLPDGTSHVFKSSEENEKNSSGLLGTGERTSQKTTVILDSEGFKRHEPSAIMILSENSIEDTNTSAKEINRYAREVEVSLHEDAIFPIFPKSIPSEKHPDHRKDISYGHSSFYFGYTVKEAGIDAFLHQPVEQVNDDAYDLGFDFDQDVFLKARAAFDERNPEETYTNLRELFADHRHASVLTKLLLTHLVPEQYEKFLVAQNPSFGGIQKRGRKVGDSEKKLQTTEAEMGLNIDLAKDAADPTAVVEDFRSEMGSDHKIRLHFHLSAEPEFLVFHITPFPYHKSNKDDAIELIVYNRDHHFIAGDNTLILDSSSADRIERKLSAKLLPDQAYIGTILFSKRDDLWGVGAAIPFKTISILPSPPASR